MTSPLSKFDPWGPISSTLYSINKSDLVELVIRSTGVAVDWPVLADGKDSTHMTRIRTFKPLIDRAYNAISADEDRGRFVQVVAKRLMRADRISKETKLILVEQLNDIGWTITADGSLTTQDVLISEQFFPPETRFDAYVAIRDILASAQTEILIVDCYLGSSIFPTLRALAERSLVVHALTCEKNLKADFPLEADKFRQQFSGIQFEVRSKPDFHDRFLRIDQANYFHVGASIKDAGSRAFLISKLQDPPVIASLAQYLEAAWNSASPVG